jgi:hypothetical protein
VDKYLVLPDQFTHRWKFQMRPVLKTVSGTPAIFPVSVLNEWPTTNWCFLNERWQWYWVDLLSLSKYGKVYKNLSKVQKFFIVRAFKGATTSDRAFNNGKGTDDYRCYPSNQNKNRPDPRMESLVCAGNFVYSAHEPVKDSKGRWMVQLYSFLENDIPPTSSLEDPRVQVATIIRRDGSLRGFPQLKGSKTYFPFLTKQPCYYPLEDLQKVS